MKPAVYATACCGLLATVGLAQTEPQAGSQPSPMEAFARQPGAHVAWASEIGRMEYDGTRAVIVALVVEDAAQRAHRMRGVRIDLSSAQANDRIYLDEEATRRTKSALEEIADAVKTHGPGGGCMGARQFWPLYDWPWNKYHELNADFCAMPGGPGLVLTGRHKPTAFRFPGRNPTQLAAMLGTALDLLKGR